MNWPPWLDTGSARVWRVASRDEVESWRRQSEHRNVTLWCKNEVFKREKISDTSTKSNHGCRKFDRPSSRRFGFQPNKHAVGAPRNSYLVDLAFLLPVICASNDAIIMWNVVRSKGWRQLHRRMPQDQRFAETQRDWSGLVIFIIARFMEFFALWRMFLGGTDSSFIAI